MPYIVLCTDSHPDAAAIRKDKLAEHLAYVDRLGPQILVAGPLNQRCDEAFDGSLFIYDVDSEAGARELLEGDPYWLAGLYAAPSFARFTPARGRWT